MNRQRLHRPSLRITRHLELDRPGRFSFEVWNPFASAYQAVETVADGVRRVSELADLISRMWLRRHPKQDALGDVPVARAQDGSRWAEFRINATAYKSYDTRYDDRPGWARVAGVTQATAMTCSKAGYALPPAIVS